MGEYQNINPYTEDLQGQLTDVSNTAKQGFSQQAGLSSDLMNQAMGQTSARQYDPNAALEQYLAQAPQVQQSVMGQYAPLQQGLNERAAQQSQQAGSQIAQQFANQGALGSGAAGQAIAQGMAQPFADVQNQLGMAQTNAVNQLLNQNLNQAYGAQQFANQAAANQAAQLLQGAGLAQQGQGIYGNLMQSALGQYGQMGQPMMEYNDPFMNALGYLGGILGLGSEMSGIGGGIQAMLNARTPPGTNTVDSLVKRGASVGGRVGG